jgi:hypothetical protein
MQFSPLPCYLVHLRPKYHSQPNLTPYTPCFLFISPFATKHVHRPTHILITAQTRMVVIPPKGAGAVINMRVCTQQEVRNLFSKRWYPQPTFLPQCDRPSSTPVQNQRQSYSSVYIFLNSTMHRMITNIPWLQGALNFIRNAVLICYGCSQTS